MLKLSYQMYLNFYFFTSHILIFRYYMCPLYFSYYHYIEYAIIVILTFNVLYYVSKVLRISLVRYEPITITQEQRKLLGVEESGTILSEFII